jgi:hypothetical protein
MNTLGRYSKEQKFRNAMEYNSHPYHWPESYWYFKDNDESLSLRNEFQPLSVVAKQNIANSTTFG